MPPAGDPTVVYRQFWSVTDHLDKELDGGWRLKSALLKTKGLSVWDGALLTPQEVAAMCKHQPCGILAIPKAAIESYGMKPDEESDPEYQRGHITLTRKINNPNPVFDAARIVLPMKGYKVRNGRRKPEGPVVPAPNGEEEDAD